MDSVLEQRIYFYRHTKRIDFETRLDWQQHQMLVKAEFPMDIMTDEAVYDVQFGNLRRPTHSNTSWDQARFEVCGHKWADLSEAGYGAALLNDGRYGYSIHDSVMELTLLTSGIFPNPEADQGVHTFTYSLYPHQGDFRTGMVAQEAYDLNCPLYARTAETGRDLQHSFLTVQEKNIFADTVKMAEDGDGIIVRMYEGWGKRTKAHLAFAQTWRIEDCQMSEKGTKLLEYDSRTVTVELTPYQVVTLRLRSVH